MTAIADSGATESPLAELAQIEDDGFLEVEAGLEGDAESVILHRSGDVVRAWLNVCPHAGRRLDWAPGKFLRNRDGQLVCAVHGATFELAQGECIATFRRTSLAVGSTVAVSAGTTMVQLMGTNVFSARLVASSMFEFGGGRHDLAHYLGEGVTQFGTSAATPIAPPPAGYDLVLPFTGSAIALGRSR